MNIGEYFKRIGFTGTPTAGLETLREIHHLHPLAIPFENISSFTGAPVSLEPDAVFDKLVTQGRGGYCFEQNLLLTQVLRDIGFSVSTHAARVIWHGIDKSTAPRTHMLLRIGIGQDDWIADVGFGGLTMTAPLKLHDPSSQSSPHEEYRITRDGDDYMISARLGDTWKAMYVFDLSTQQPSDFALANYFVATHPESRFVQNLVMARPFKNGRHAFFNNTWVKYSRDGQKTEKVLGNPVDVVTLIGEIFKISLQGSVDPNVLHGRLAEKLSESAKNQ